jgi:hypothetical protein
LVFALSSLFSMVITFLNGQGRRELQSRLTLCNRC